MVEHLYCRLGHCGMTVQPLFVCGLRSCLQGAPLSFLHMHLRENYANNRWRYVNGGCVCHWIYSGHAICDGQFCMEIYPPFSRSGVKIVQIGFAQATKEVVVGKWNVSYHLFCRRNLNNSRLCFFALQKYRNKKWATLLGLGKDLCFWLKWLLR